MTSTNQLDSDSFPNSDAITLTARLLDGSKKPVSGCVIDITPNYDLRVTCATHV